MTCLHNHDQILEFLWKIFLKGFQIYQNYLCALINIEPSVFVTDSFNTALQHDVNHLWGEEFPGHLVLDGWSICVGQDVVLESFKRPALERIHPGVGYGTLLAEGFIGVIPVA